jgi:hypothetical protein
MFSLVFPENQLNLGLLRIADIVDIVDIGGVGDLKIAGKYDFFKFCKPYISSRSHPTQEIFYIQTLGGSAYKLEKFEDISGGGTPRLNKYRSRGSTVREEVPFYSKNVTTDFFCIKMSRQIKMKLLKPI